jgi:hypothetical protein
MNSPPSVGEQIMRLTNILPIAILALTTSLAIAEDVNCSDLANPQARRECMKKQSGAEVDCTKIADPEARKECAGNSADCSKLATPEARRKCAEEKAK